MSTSFLPPGIVDARLKAEKDYWLEKLSAARAVPAVPADYLRSTGPRSGNETVEIAIDEHTIGRALTICNRKAELILALLAATLKACIHRWTGLEDIIICTTIHEQYGDLAPLNKVLALRDRVLPSSILRDLMHDVKRTLFEAYANQKYPFGRILDQLGVARPDARVPITNVAILLRNINNRENLNHLKFDLTFLFSLDGEALSGSIEYDPKLFRPETVEMMAGHFSEALSTVAADGEKRVGEIELSSPRESGPFESEWTVHGPTFGGPLYAGSPFRPAALAAHDSETPPLERHAGRKYFPLTREQEGLWNLHLKGPGSDSGNVVAILTLYGKLDLTSLEEGINEIVRRHEVLRATFAANKEGPVQIVAPRALVGLPVIDLSMLREGNREQETARLAMRLARSRFDLSRGPLFAASLVCGAEDVHSLILAAHELIFDRASIPVFIRELAAAYSALSKGRPSPPGEPSFQFGDFALWQQKWLQERIAGHCPEKIGGAQNGNAPGLRAGPGDPRGPARNAGVSRIAVTVPAEVKKGLEELSRSENAPLFMTLLSAFTSLLFRYRADAEIEVGVPDPNRELFETEGMIGPLSRWLLVRAKVSGNISFRDLIARVSEASVNAYAGRYLPVANLPAQSNGKGRAGESPVPRAVFNLNPSANARMEVCSLTIELTQVLSGPRGSDLFLDLSEKGGGLEASMLYNRDLFEPRTIEIMLAHFTAMAKDAAARPDTRLIDLSLDENVKAGAESAAPGFEGTDEVEQFDFQL
ncbi:MAG TPA: condensation domain-containing protein [Blastocatellia bacterium]|nr:condensation domain-containing protein [Blastocatellia bacterium]